MSDPITRPGELARIAGNDMEYRIRVMSDLEVIKEHNRRHEEDDREQFAEIRDNIKELASRLGNVSSSVNEGEKTFKKYDGIKIGIGLAASFFLAVGAAIWTVFTFFSSRSP